LPERGQIRGKLCGPAFSNRSHGSLQSWQSPLQKMITLNRTRAKPSVPAFEYYRARTNARL
jgi:hypothetical protein